MSSDEEQNGEISNDHTANGAAPSSTATAAIVAAYEEKYKARYTENDQLMNIYRERDPPNPPVIYPWHPVQPRPARYQASASAGAATQFSDTQRKGKPHSDDSWMRSWLSSFVVLLPWHILDSIIRCPHAMRIPSFDVPRLCENKFLLWITAGICAADKNLRKKMTKKCSKNWNIDFLWSFY